MTYVFKLYIVITGYVMGCDTGGDWVFSLNPCYYIGNRSPDLNDRTGTIIISRIVLLQMCDTVFVVHSGFFPHLLSGCDNFYLLHSSSLN